MPEEETKAITAREATAKGIKAEGLAGAAKAVERAQYDFGWDTKYYAAAQKGGLSELLTEMTNHKNDLVANADKPEKRQDR